MDNVKKKAGKGGYSGPTWGERIKLWHWLRSVFCISFSAMTLLVGVRKD